MAVEIPDVGQADFVTWATSAAYLSGATTDVPQAPDEVRWREWAVALGSAPPLKPYGLPDPYRFLDWRDWAAAMRQTFTGT